MLFKKNYWIRSGTYTIMQRMAAFLFGFGSYFFLVRYCTVEEFGIWALYVVVSTSVEMARSSFIQNAFIKFFNEDDTDKNKLFSGSLLLNTLSTFLFVILLLLLNPLLQSFWNSEAVGGLVLWYCATSVVLIPFTQLNYLEQANHRFAGVFWSAFARQGTFFCIVVICYFFFPGKSLSFFAGAQCFSAFIGLGVALAITRKMIPVTRSIDWVLVKKLVTFGKYILGTGITSTIGKNTDHVLLGGVSHQMVALYNSGIRILNFIEVPTYAISNIVYPKIAERASKEGPYSAGLLYEKSVATILGFILPFIVAIFIFPEFFLYVTAGKKYLDNADNLRIMILAITLLPFNIQVGSVCEVVNKPHISFYINLVANILNVVLNIFLIKIFGIMGAAISFLVTLIFIFSFGQWYVSKHLNVRLWRIFSHLISFYRSLISNAAAFVREKVMTPKTGER